MTDYKVVSFDRETASVEAPLCTQEFFVKDGNHVQVGARVLIQDGCEKITITMLQEQKQWLN